jgi:hypothetical protein
MGAVLNVVVKALQLAPIRPGNSGPGPLTNANVMTHPGLPDYFLLDISVDLPPLIEL